MPFVRVSNLSQTRFDISGCDYLTHDAVSRHRLRVFPTGTIVFPKSGASIRLEKRAILPHEACLASHLAAILPDERIVDRDFLFYFLVSTRLAQGNADGYPTLRLSDIAQLAVPLPPLREQRRIARILGKIQRARDATELVVSTTSRVKAAALDEIFGGDNGLPMQPLAAVAQVKTSFPVPARLTPSSIDDPDHMLFLKVSDIGRSPNAVVTAAAAVFQKSDKALAVGATVFPKRGGAIGTNVKRMIGRPAVLDPNLIGIEPSPQLLPRFLLGFFESIDLRDLQDNTPVPQLNKHNVDVLSIPVPTLAKQTEACLLLDALDRKASADRTLKLRLSALFQSAQAHFLGGAP
jgi:type I restriction enzyme, S subunit